MALDVDTVCIFYSDTIVNLKSVTVSNIDCTPKFALILLLPPGDPLLHDTDFLGVVVQHRVGDLPRGGLRRRVALRRGRLEGRRGLRRIFHAAVLLNRGGSSGLDLMGSCAFLYRDIFCTVW